MGIPLFVFSVRWYAISCCRLKKIWSVRPFAATALLVVVNPAVRFIMDCQYRYAGDVVLVPAVWRFVAKLVSGKLLFGSFGFVGARVTITQSGATNAATGSV